MEQGHSHAQKDYPSILSGMQAHAHPLLSDQAQSLKFGQLWISRPCFYSSICPGKTPVLWTEIFQVKKCWED